MIRYNRVLPIVFGLEGGQPCYTGQNCREPMTNMVLVSGFSSHLIWNKLQNDVLTSGRAIITYPKHNIKHKTSYFLLLDIQIKIHVFLCNKIRL